MLKFTSYYDLSQTIRKNIWKIPHEIDCIVGIPRSGMLVAIMISEYLNIPVKSLQDYINNAPIVAGGRGSRLSNQNYHRVLILDDTVYSGNSINQAKNKLTNIHPEDEKIFACIYAEGEHAHENVNLFMERNYCPNLDFYHLYEWNIFHHGNGLTSRTMMDMDGVLCKNPPDERNTKDYEKYLPVADPMFIPSTPIQAIVTYRLEKYRGVTFDWLEKNGVLFNRLVMANFPDYATRGSVIKPAKYKSDQYTNSDAILFIESDSMQAQEIFTHTGKAVYCIEDSKFYPTC